MAVSTLVIRLLGSFEAARDGVPLPLSPLERGVLARLALDVGRVVSTEALTDALWTGTAPASARTRVQALISGLRRKTAGGAEDLVVSRAPGYRLRTDGIDLDVAAFERLVDAALAAAAIGGIEEAATRLRKALAMWRGPALAGVDAPYAEAARVRLQERRLYAMEERVRLDLLRNRPEDLIPELAGLVADNPLRERLRGQLMLALSRAGRRVHALDTYRGYERLLGEEYGLEPGAELRALHLSILTENDRPAPAIGPPAIESPATSSAATGLPATGLPGTDPGTGGEPAPSLPAPAQLPPVPGTFVGRVRHLAALDALLPDGPDAGAGTHPPIGVITGTGGAGKTTLALRWAHRVADRFPGGQFYVDLRGWSRNRPLSPLEALGGFLRALGAPGDQIPVDVDEAAALFRSHLAARTALVMLDNAASVEQVRPLLPGNPSCLVLVTSRDTLAGLVARHGATRLDTGPLEDPEAVALLHALVAAPLRATPAGAGRMVGEAAPEAAGAIAEIARLCGGLPLALRIAGIHLGEAPERDAAGYAAMLRLGDRLSSLAIEGDPEFAIAATFDLSYRRLEPDRQRFFRLLGAVPGPDVPLAAMAALAGWPAGEARPALDRLVATHLVYRSTADRYAMHDLLRSYAAQSLARAGEATEARKQLWHWYLRCADAAAMLLHPHAVRLPLPAGLPPAPGTAEWRSGDRDAAQAWLDVERANLVAVIHDAAGYGDPVTWLLADRLRVYLWSGGYLADWLAVAGRALAAAGRAGDRPARCAALVSLSYAHFYAGQLQSALRYARRGLRYDERAYNVLGNVYWRLGRLGKATGYYQQALDSARRLGQDDTVLLISIGNVQFEGGQLARARATLTEAMTGARRTGADTIEAVCLVNLAAVEADLGRFADATGHLHGAAALGARSGRVLDGPVRTGLAAIDSQTGRLAAAQDQGSQAMRAARAAGDRETETESLNVLAAVDLAGGHHHAATTRSRGALRLARAHGYRYAEVVALVGLAAGYLVAVDPASAWEPGEQALRLARERGYRRLYGQALAVRAGYRLATGEPRSALTPAHHSLAVYRETGYRLGEAPGLRLLARVLRATGRPDAAEAAEARADRMAGALGVATALSHQTHG